MAMPGVVGHVEPLVRIGGPRVRALGAGHEPAQARRRRRPQPERAVDVQPGAARGAGVRDRPERVERAGVDLARLRADDRRARSLVERRGQRTGVHPALVVGRDPRARPAPSPSRRSELKIVDVRLLTDEHVDGRRADQAALLHVPARRRAAPRGAPPPGGRVRPLPAGDEADARALRQPEQVDDPAPAHLLDHSRGGREHLEAGVLVPGRGHPVRRHGHRQRAADDEPEEARPG